jgi:hypothetical protein
MRRRVGGCLAIWAAALLAAIGGTSAWAYWTVTVGATAHASGDTLPTGAVPTTSVTYSGGTATVTVGITAKSTTGGTAISTYLVQRFAAASGGTAAASFSCTLPTACTETAVPSGTWYYADTPTLGTWQGSASSRSPVTVNTTRHFLVAPAGGTTQTAGTAFGLTITAQNSDGTTDTGYTGSHAIVWTFNGTAHNSPSGAAPTLPSGSPYTFSAGVATIPSSSGATLTKAETGVTLTATDSALTITGTTAAITVTAGAPAKLCITVNPSCSGGSTIVVATKSTTSSSVYLEDAFGNVATATATVTVTLAVSPANNGSVSPSSLTIASGQTTSAGSFTFTAASASGKAATVTGSSAPLTSATVTFST